MEEIIAAYNNFDKQIAKHWLVPPQIGILCFFLLFYDGKLNVFCLELLVKQNKMQEDVTLGSLELSSIFHYLLTFNRWDNQVINKAKN